MGMSSSSVLQIRKQAAKHQNEALTSPTKKRQVHKEKLCLKVKISDLSQMFFLPISDSECVEKLT
jgi:hypothetical protein